MGGRSLYTLLYVAATTICVGISIYLSYYGYYSHLQELAIFFAVLLGLFLFGTDLLIRRFRLEGQSLLKPLAFFAVIALFSGASNYNFLYTNFMERDMAERVVSDQFSVFRDNLTATRRTLEASPVVTQVQAQRDELERSLESLQSQISDPLRPGCGQRCQDHVEAIYEQLGGPPTELAMPTPGAGSEAHQRWYEHFRSAVLNDFDNSAVPDAYQRAEALIARIDELLERYDDPQAALSEELQTRGRALTEHRDFAIIARLRNLSREVARQANAVLPEEEAVNHAAIRSDLDKLGEIPISIRDGFLDRPNPGVTAVSVILGVFVDVAPVLFAWLIFAPAAAAGGSRGEDVRWPRRGRRSRVATR